MTLFHDAALVPSAIWVEKDDANVVPTGLNRRRFCGAAATVAAGTLGSPFFFSEGSMAMSDKTALTERHAS